MSERGLLGAELASTEARLMLADELAPGFATANPFPHAVIDGLFDDDLLRRIAEELPSRADGDWVSWDTAHEKKYVLSTPERFGPTTRALADELSGAAFVSFLERLTGVDGLIPDPYFEAAGYFDIPPGGYLDAHLDFATNERLGLVRRLNVLIYLNEGWQPGWGGDLVLSDSLDGPAVHEIVPVMNRTVVFLTPNAAHGHPAPVTAPDGRHRLCFSAYYYTSPSRADSPRIKHGVVFDGSPWTVAARRHARRWLPPVAFDAAAAARRRVDDLRSHRGS